jgi:hypothetical protein
MDVLIKKRKIKKVAVWKIIAWKGKIAEMINQMIPGRNKLNLIIWITGFCEITC